MLDAGRFGADGGSMVTGTGPAGSPVPGELNVPGPISDEATPPSGLSPTGLSLTGLTGSGWSGCDGIGWSAHGRLTSSVFISFPGSGGNSTEFGMVGRPLVGVLGQHRTAQGRG